MSGAIDMLQGAAMPIRLPGAPPRPEEEAATLRQALIESRQRWRQFGAIATDLAFETDAAGRLSFIAPDYVLGWSAAELLGQPASFLLCDPAGPNVFAATVPQHRRPTWLHSRSEGPVCMAVSVLTMRDRSGHLCGTRGVAVNITEQERANTASAAALRRGEVLDTILGRMRREVLAPRMMQAMLEAVLRALGGRGAAVVHLLPTDGRAGGSHALYAAGVEPSPVLMPVAEAFGPSDDGTVQLLLPDGIQVLACPCSTRFGERAALTVWRSPGSRGWDEDDLTLIGSVGGVVRMVLEHESIQRELARQARTDPLTGLLNRRAFMEEATRRLDRLERDGLPGTLMYLDLDRLKQLNDRRGHEAGDSALVLVSGLLNRVFRPTDLIARLGGDEFAVWLDGADSLTSAERAEELRLCTPQELAHLATDEGEVPGMSIGIATRDAGSDETLEQLIQRADVAMYVVKKGGRGNWHVSHSRDAG